MQALLLNGSPRGAASNTLRLSRAFLQGTGWPFETFSLTDKRIEPCRGCMACWRSGAPCTIADDFSAFCRTVPPGRRADCELPPVLFWSSRSAQSPAGSDDQPDGAIPTAFRRRRAGTARSRRCGTRRCGARSSSSSPHAAIRRPRPCMKRCWPSLTGCAAAGIIRPCFSRRASCSRWKSWTGAARRPPSAGLRGGRPGICRNGNALGADACRGTAADKVDPRVYEILARAQWRGGAERNKQP